jgi:hypothetical protein
MDAQTFDRLTVAMAKPPTRRRALRLLTAGLLGGLLAPRLARAVQRPDRDGDGLFDDDEELVYGTNPDVFDSDGDGSGDGEEVYYGANPLDAGSVAGVVGDGNDVTLAGTPDEVIALGGEQGEAVACDEAAGLVNCGAACANLAFDPLHCGYCGNVCPGGNGYEGVCSMGVCSLASVPGNGGVIHVGDVHSNCDDVPLPPGCYCVFNGQCVIADAGG